MNFNRTNGENFRFGDAGTVEQISYADAVELMQNDARLAESWPQQQVNDDYVYVEHCGQPATYAAEQPAYDADRRPRSRSSSRGRYTKRRRSEDGDDDRSSRPRSGRRSRSRSRSLSRSPSRGHGYRRTSRSHSHSRSRSPGRRYSRSRSRSYDREHNEDYSADSGYRYSRTRREDVPPNSTVILKGLPLFCDEALIWDVIGRQGFMPKDVRVVRRRDTGGNRGFAFVEFSDVNEAMRWMVYTQGRVQLDERTIVDVEYSFTKTSGSSSALQASHSTHSSGIGDWTCARCYTHNFKKRDSCFKCNIRRDESEALVSDGFNEIGVMPCDTLLLRNLPLTADEQRVLICVNKLSGLEVRRVMIARHTETRQSRGFAYLEMHGVTEAAQLLTTLTAVTKLNIDGREIFVSYSKHPFEAVMSGANLADDSTSQLSIGASSRFTNRPSTSSGLMPTDVTNAAAAVAQSAIQKAQVMRQVAANYLPGGASSLAPSTTPVAGGGRDLNSTAALLSQQQRAMAAAGTSASYTSVSLGVVQTPHGELPRYPVPDVSTFQYESSSGYYYDATTGLYYDVKSQYYYNAETQQYLYWDSTYQTYLPVPTSQSATNSNVDQQSLASDSTKSQTVDVHELNKKPSDKKEKVKIAKKIQKDMEKWAKQCDKNIQKKDARGVASANATESQDVKPSGAADAAFSVLEKTTRGLTTGLVSYEAGDSDDESTANSGTRGFHSMPGATSNEDVDFGKMACLLCRRQFPSREVLLKHQQFSDLHKQNLEAKQKSNISASEQMLLTMSDQCGGQYRDRAKERRQKFGDDDRPMKNRLKEKYLESLGSGEAEQPTVSGIKSDNIGNKLLKNMGWQEGQGLGRANQGIIDPVTQKRRGQGVGLGVSAIEADESATYKEQVMAVMRQKYYGGGAGS